MKRAALLLAAALLVAACSRESASPLGPAPGTYRGAPDQKPWDSAPQPWSTSTWKQGDRDSWLAALRQRAQGQNEFTRKN